MARITWNQLVKHYPSLFGPLYGDKYSQLFMGMHFEDHRDLVNEIRTYLKNHRLSAVQVQALAAYMNFSNSIPVVISLWSALNSNLKNLFAVHPFVATKVVMMCVTMTPEEEKLYFHERGINKLMNPV